MNLSFLTCYTVPPEISGHRDLLLTLANAILLPLSASYFLIFIYVMVLLESEDVYCFGLPWGASLPDEVDGFAFCTCWLHLPPFIIFCFLCPNEQQCDELKRQSINEAQQKKFPKERIAREPVKH